MKNIWKTLFFILLGLDLVIIILIIALLTSSTHYDDNISEKNKQSGPIQIVVDNDTVEKVINEQIDDDKMHVTINKEEVLVNVEYEVVGIDVPITISIEPLVNGDQIILKLEDIDVGKLPINSNLLYDYLKDYISLGKGMSFSEDSRAIIIDSKLFSDDLEYNVQIDDIDYEHDKWFFSIEDLL